LKIVKRIFLLIQTTFLFLKMAQIKRCNFHHSTTLMWSHFCGQLMNRLMEGGQQGRNPSHLHPISVSLNTHHSTLNSFMPITLGSGSKDSFTIRGWQLWLKHFMSTLYALYFRSVFIVSSCVLNEFIKTRGTLQPYLTFNRCGVKCKKGKTSATGCVKQKVFLLRT